MNVLGSPAVPETGWRQEILRHFSPQLAESFSLTLVHDPDGLLADQLVLSELRRHGFVAWTYDDPLRFRFEYETEARGLEDAGGTSPSIVVVYRGTSLQELPFDVLARARASHREFEFSLARLFPSLSAAALEDVEPLWVERLYRALEAHPTGERRGRAASMDFLLSAVFAIDVDTLADPSDLLAALCRLHLERRHLPASLAGHLAARLDGLGQATGWPIEAFAEDRGQFLTFLEDQWSVFVERASREDGGATAPLSGDGTTIGVPFDSPRVKGWIAALFLEGQLRPVDWSGTAESLPRSLRWGLAEPEAPRLEERIRVLAEELRRALPSADGTSQDWLSFAPRWAQLAVFRDEASQLAGETTQMLESLWASVDVAFRTWMESRFGLLEQEPGLVMLHRIMRHLEVRRSSGVANKVALFVIDGMAWSQWLELRARWADRGWSLSDRSVFAWVPTITPVSRQALFSGRPPREFHETIGDTAKDKSHWDRFWMDAGLSSDSIQFVPPKRSETNEAALTRLRDAAQHPLCKVLAMTATTIDHMAHGAVNGSGLQAQVRDWARGGWFHEGIDLLLAEGFEVWVTSDHGNLECTGSGRPNEGALVGERGVRARVFDDETVRGKIAEAFPNSIRWNPSGLPSNYLPLLSSGSSAYATDGQVLLGHGGISLEEVIVPLVRIGCVES